MKVNYNRESPYATTEQTIWYMELMKPRSLEAQDTDKDYTIPAKYHHRPDLAANELFGNVQYWWVFAKVNKNTIIDPLYDFESGKTIRIPTLERVQNMR